MVKTVKELIHNIISLKAIKTRMCRSSYRQKEIKFNINQINYFTKNKEKTRQKGKLKIKE